MIPINLLLIHQLIKSSDMWANSKPHEYLSFRVFIFGITSQSMFPNGVVYDGVLDNKPLSFRGESGANDSMVRGTPPTIHLYIQQLTKTT